MKNPRDGGAWWAAVYGIAQSWTRLKRLSSSSTGVGDHWLLLPFTDTWASQVALVVKNPPANVCLKRHRFDPWAGAGRGEDPLEEEMATHCSISAWRIPWTEEPGGLQFMGSQSQKLLKWLGMHAQFNQTIGKLHSL